MNTHGTDQQQKPTLKQLEELLRFTQGQTAAVVARYFATATFDEIQSVLKNQKNVGRTFEQLLAPLFASADPHRALRAYWEKIYQEHYGLEADFSQVSVPQLPTEGKWRYIFVLKGLTMNHAAVIYEKVIVAYDSRNKFWKYHADLDVTVTNNIRTSAESYVICVRDEPEPDTGYLGKSARSADPEQQIGVTLLERLVHGAIHFIETKKHLDEVGVTFCTGSRNSHGCVPYVCCHPDSRKVRVLWCDVDNARPRGGLRQAVSL